MFVSGGVNHIYRTAASVPSLHSYQVVFSRSISNRRHMRTKRRGWFLTEADCQRCPSSSQPPVRSAGTCPSHLGTSHNDGLGGCRGNPEEIPHAEWRGPWDLHDSVQEPLGSGDQVQPLTSFTLPSSQHISSSALSPSLHSALFSL